MNNTIYIPFIIICLTFEQIAKAEVGTILHREVANP